jgi:hypothetical protein
LLGAQRAVITLATTKMLYVEMAFVLARSFVLWNRDTGILFHIVTDLEFEMPHELRGHVHVIRVPFGTLGVGFSPKLHLDEFAPAPQTLFIDADCLVMGPLASVFDRFAGRPVSVVGSPMKEGRWWCTVEDVLKRIGRPSLPSFNGGVYYIEPGPQATAVYARARALEGLYDEWELVRLRGRPNDEILVSIAMAEANLEAIPNDGTVMVPCNLYQVFRELDVFTGRCVLENPPATHKLHWKTAPVQTRHPVIPHFVDTFTRHWRYLAEAECLRLHMHVGLPRFLARLIASLTISLPSQAKANAKDWLRPIYRAFFGLRTIQKSERI